jgi:UDP-glucose 4,6-dehydratase
LNGEEEVEEEEEEEEEDDDDDDEITTSLRSSFCEWDQLQPSPLPSASSTSTTFNMEEKEMENDRRTRSSSTSCCSSSSSFNLPKNYKFIKGNICVPDLVEYILQTEQIDTILHFAAQSHVDNSFGNSIEFSKTNILGTHVLLEASRIYGKIKRFIHVSTDEVYGEGQEKDQEEMKEDHTLEPTNPYAASKAGAEFLVKAFHHSFQLPMIITRSNNVYGPHQYPEKLIPKCINQLMRQQKVTIHGDGTNTRNYLYISDVVQAFDVILHQGLIGQVYNIGGSNEKSNLQVVQDIFQLMKIKKTQNTKWIQYVQDRPFNDRRYTIDASQLRNLGWKEKVTWEEGLMKTIHWYQKHGNHFQNIEKALEPHPLAFKKTFTI